VSYNELLWRIEKCQARVGIIGMGYVGLPLVRAFYEAGFPSLGFDTDAKKVRQLNAGKSYIKHIPSRLVREMVQSGRFEATTDPKRLSECDAILICVPTPLTRTREPDLTYVRSTAETIRQHLRRGQLVVLESTTYPGTTREELVPILEQSGLKAGRDFYVAFSPEREDPGSPSFTTSNIPKVVGGLDRRSGWIARALYGQVVKQVVPVSSCEVAEATKILENVYRAVNIALVNEMKMLFDRMGIDVWEVIEAAATKPFGFGKRENKTLFTPGPGLGGHCIPIDPFYLTWKARQFGMPTRFIELAGEINTAMPEYVVGRVTAALNDRGKPVKGSRILILGLAYKKDVDDMRESPAVELIRLLRDRGALVDYNDPHIPRAYPQRHYALRMRSKPLSAAMLAKYDCVLIATDHSAYDYDWIVRHAQLVVDTRNATAVVRAGRDKIVKA